MRAFWRNVALPALSLALIGALLWYAEAGNGLPLIGNDDSDKAAQRDGTFYSLESQGIKLGPSSGSAPREGDPAPDFVLLDLSGEAVRLSDFKGQVVVLNFWATWCTPCRQEFPRFVDAYETHRPEGLAIIGVNLRESATGVRKFADTYGATFPILLDTQGSVASQYQLQGLPMTWFIDRDWIARAQVIGLVTEGLFRTSLAEAGFTLP